MTEHDDDMFAKTMVITPGNLPVTFMAGDQSDKAPKAKLVCLDMSQFDQVLPSFEIELEGTEQILGRDHSNPSFIPSKTVSRFHARVYPGDGKWGIEDLGSTNGIRVNGVKVKELWLEGGEKVEIGTIPFRYELEQAASRAKAASSEVDKTMVYDLRTSTMRKTSVSHSVPTTPQLRVQAKPPGQRASKKSGNNRAVYLVVGVIAIVTLLGVGLYFGGYLQ